MALKYEQGKSTGIYVEGRWHATGRVGMYKFALMKTSSAKSTRRACLTRASSPSP